MLRNFMILGFFSTISNAIKSVVRWTINLIVDEIVPIFMKIICDSIIPAAAGIVSIIVQSNGFNAAVAALIQLVLAIIEVIITALLGGRKQMTAKIITAIFSTYDFITSPSRLECLSWSPINYIFRGEDKNVVVGSMTNPYYLSIKLMNEGIKPTAMIIFALIIMVELFQITVRTEGMRNSGFESPFKLMLKVAICKILLDNTELILRAIFEAGTDIVIRIGSISRSISIVPTGDTLQVFTDSLLKFRPLVLFLMVLQTYLQCGFVWLIMKFFLPLIVLSRMAEIYMMIVLAPIPFATFAHQEFSSVGKSYLKQFIGVSFKAAVMFVIVLIYGSLMTIATIDIANAEILRWTIQLVISLISFGLWIPGLIVFLIAFGLKPIFFSFMLLSALQGADSYTRKITGAWY